MSQFAAAYIRVSTDDQLEFSLDAQIKALKDYAKKNDMIILNEHIYADEGISGKRADKRPSFMKMIATSKKKPRPFDVILVHKFDRFARSREDSVVYKSMLKRESGIRVISITEQMEDDKFSVILEAMLEAMAEYYSLNLSDEVKKGMTEKATRGELQTCPCFGYKAQNNQLVIIPEEAQYVKFIFEKFANQEMGMRQIAIYLNDIGVKTHRGGNFENRTIDYILNNPTYISMLRWNPAGKLTRKWNDENIILAKSTHEPIISQELWEKTQALLKDRKQLYKKGQHKTVTIKHWSQGLVRCGNCGRALCLSSLAYYQCGGYAKGKCKISHAIKIEKLETLVCEQLKKIFQNEIKVTIVPKETSPLSTEYKILSFELSQYDDKLKRIKEAYRNGIDTLEEYKESKEALEKEQTLLNQKMESLKNHLKGEKQENIYHQIKSVYDLLTDKSIPIDVKYKASHFLINKITFYKQKNIIEIEYK
ncbi:recombinase family protein [Thomasclavelia cocleata]|uniref:recombinase family protein n=1 Tax=Thomasclavelia cocleata TaxID=69824 RepID=UPI0035197428